MGQVCRSGLTSLTEPTIEAATKVNEAWAVIRSVSEIIELLQRRRRRRNNMSQFLTDFMNKHNNGFQINKEMRIYMRDFEEFLSGIRRF